MLAEETQKRQNDLNYCIYEMAKSIFADGESRRIALKLKGLYTFNFRHNYSEFFPIILDIFKDNKNYSLDYLSNNLELLRLYVENDYVSGNKEFTTLYPPLAKLCDHLNLEIGRLSYYSMNEEKINDLEKRNDSLHVEIKNATNELKDAKEKASSIQTELVAVLGIFSAIVIAFSGSISFVGNALSGISNTPIFKATFFILLCGFVLFNLIFLLMYLISKITCRNIYARCISYDCTCGEDGKPKCNGINRIRKRLPYVFWFNAVIIVLFIVDIALWKLNFL